MASSTSTSGRRTPWQASAASPLITPYRPRPGDLHHSRAALPIQSLLRLSLCRCQAAPEGKKAVAEKPARAWGQQERGTLVPSSSSSDSSSPKEWGFFKWELYNTGWNVPWGPGRVAGGLVLWFLSFLFVSFVAVPEAYQLAGIDIFKMAPEVGYSPVVCVFSGDASPFLY